MKYLDLEDFDLNPINVKTYFNENDENEFNYMHISVEMLKKMAEFHSIISCITNIDENGNPSGWERDKAVIVGLMVRNSKLIVSVIENVCNRKMEIVNILERCIIETCINIEYLIKHFSKATIDEFVSYSLRTEKKLMTTIQTNINEREEILPIEKRMIRSINASFEKSSISLEEVDEDERKTWGGSIFNRFRDLDKVAFYNTAYGLQSHFVHGNWQEVMSNHLEYNSGLFQPNMEWGKPRPQALIPLCIIVGDTLRTYLKTMIPEHTDKEIIETALDSLITESENLNNRHEEYLISKSGVNGA